MSVNLRSYRRKRPKHGPTVLPFHLLWWPRLYANAYRLRKGKASLRPHGQSNFAGITRRSCSCQRFMRLPGLERIWPLSLVLPDCALPDRALRTVSPDRVLQGCVILTVFGRTVHCRTALCRKEFGRKVFGRTALSE